MRSILQAICIIIFLFACSSSVYAGEIITDQKLITVDLGKQMLYAWEKGQVVHQTKVSTGLPKTPTVKGSFAVKWKVPSQTMRGGSKAYGTYEYKNVPHVMYFYQGYAIHGAYWHNRFGRPNSHGCVNVPLTSAEWLYNWAQKGTRVEVF
ncbi:L,D-transpeptidase [Candidatus Gottesmanbacteria bacterium]|nr:L,D-transpeptidase [Candidatus Gottesmanbacteria bacterium]